MAKKTKKTRKAKKLDLAEALKELRALPRPAMDFTTPEGAILCLEDAYRRQDIEAAVACKDFAVEATLLLLETAPDLANDAKIRKQTAKVLELGYRKEHTDNWPDMKGMESFFVERRPAFQDLAIVIVTEFLYLPKRGLEEVHLRVSKRKNGWRVLNPV